jgi:hypothetical protein
VKDFWYLAQIDVRPIIEFDNRITCAADAVD